MSSWLFNVYMDGVVRDVNARVLWKWLKVLSVNCGRFECYMQRVLYVPEFDL